MDFSWYVLVFPRSFVERMKNESVLGMGNLRQIGVIEYVRNPAILQFRKFRSKIQLALAESIGRSTAFRNSKFPLFAQNHQFTPHSSVQKFEEIFPDCGNMVSGIQNRPKLKVNSKSRDWELGCNSLSSQNHSPRPPTPANPHSIS